MVKYILIIIFAATFVGCLADKSNNTKENTKEIQSKLDNTNICNLSNVNYTEDLSILSKNNPLNLFSNKNLKNKKLKN